MSDSKRVIAFALGVVGVIVAFIVLTGITFVRTDGGHVAVVRNGGPFDNNKIRDVIQPSSSRKLEGMYSQEHQYPANQRYYTITSDNGAGDRPGVDVFKGTTSDGVQGIGIEGTVQFVLNTDRSLLESFDNRFGTRTYPVAGTSDSLHAWEGDKGWEAFLDAVFRRQILDNALRIEIQKYRCVELIPSCAYLGNSTTGTTNGKPNGSTANSNLAEIQTNISQELQADLDQTLGGKYLTIGKFTISKVDLPVDVEHQIEQANAAKVAVQRQHYDAQKVVQEAIGERRANEQKAKGIEALNRAYAHSQQKAAIDAIAALPSGLTTLVIGGKGGLSQLVGGK